MLEENSRVTRVLQSIHITKIGQFRNKSSVSLFLSIYLYLSFPEVFPIFRDLFYLSRVHILIQETIFSAPLKWHCSFHKNLNGATLGVIPSSFNLLLFLGISDFFLTVLKALLHPFRPPQELYKQPNGLIALPTSKSCENKIAIYLLLNYYIIVQKIYNNF